MQRRVADAQHAEDIAAECVARAWQCFRATTPDKVRVLVWARIVARRLIVSHYRRRRFWRRETQDTHDLATAAVPEHEVAAQWLCEALARRLEAEDRCTLGLLRADVSIDDIAALRGITARAVRSSRGRIRAVAALLGNDSASLPP